MRQFDTLSEAIDEIRRDVMKGTRMTYSRVQQFTGVEMEGFERMPYHYSIRGGWPATDTDLIHLAMEKGFEVYKEHPREMQMWLSEEKDSRLRPIDHKILDPALPYELDHPILQNTLEGEYPSYTYPDRMLGALETLGITLTNNLDSRRAFWPIFHPQDSLRAMAPTRIPCSLGYQATIRRVGDRDQVMFFYMSRSVDFDTFWLSDIWLAHEFHSNLVRWISDHEVSSSHNYELGVLTHYIISLHSFDDRKEVY
jgi:hypothetical protein